MKKLILLTLTVLLCIDYVRTECTLKCLNGGSLNTQSCTCECFPGYSGDFCQKFNCSQQSEQCGTSLIPEYCGVEDIDNYCAKMCTPEICKCGFINCLNDGIFESSTCSCRCPLEFEGEFCEKPKVCSNQLVCKNEGIFNSITCQCECYKNYNGTECENINCEIPDPSDCSTYDVQYCTVSVISSYCPHLCGGCIGSVPKPTTTPLPTTTPKTCPRSCQNGGTLNNETCTCVCFPSYLGDFCETLLCNDDPVNVCQDAISISLCSVEVLYYYCPKFCGRCSGKTTTKSENTSIYTDLHSSVSSEPITSLSTTESVSSDTSPQYVSTQSPETSFTSSSVAETSVASDTDATNLPSDTTVSSETTNPVETITYSVHTSTALSSHTSAATDGTVPSETTVDSDTTIRSDTTLVVQTTTPFDTGASTGSTIQPDTTVPTIVSSETTTGSDTTVPSETIFSTLNFETSSPVTSESTISPDQTTIVSTDSQSDTSAPLTSQFFETTTLYTEIISTGLPETSIPSSFESSTHSATTEVTTGSEKTTFPVSTSIGDTTVSESSQSSTLVVESTQTSLSTEIISSESTQSSIPTETSTSDVSTQTSVTDTSTILETLSTDGQITEQTTQCPSLQCQNGGQFIQETCSCACLLNYNGELCENLVCTKDEATCQDITNIDCTTSVKYNCPFKCSLCSTSTVASTPQVSTIKFTTCAPITCLNEGYLDQSTCKCVCLPGFTGTDCSEIDCDAGNQDPKECDYFFCEDEELKYYCPKTCLCANQTTTTIRPVTLACQPKTCNNGGVFSPVTCTCSCLDGFSGDNCEKKQDCNSLPSDPEECEIGFCSDEDLKLICPKTCCT